MNILSIDGGGYLGLASAAFIAETERSFKETCHNKFNLFCGTSTGAIIALGLASGKTGKEIAELYKMFGKAVFNNKFFGRRYLRIVTSIVMARYSNTALRKILYEAFGDLTLGDLKKQGKYVVVAAFNLSTGRPRIFKTDHSSDLNRDDGYFIRDIALASSAAPTFLPIVKLYNPHSKSEERFCDGGVFANHPALLGYAEAVSHLNIEPKKIQILSISTPRADLAEYDSDRNFIQRFVLSRGLISWGGKLASIPIDATSMIAHETLRRVFAWKPEDKGRYVRVELRKPPGVDLDIASPQSTTTLSHLGMDEASKSLMKSQLGVFFAN